MGVRQHAYSLHTLRSCSAWPQLHAVGHLAALTFNANGLRALLAILPLIFQTAQRPEPAPFTSSHNPASLTFGAFLTLHFPPSTLFFYSFPLTVPAPNPFLSPIQSVLYDHPLFFVFNKEVVIQAPDSNWVSTYYQHGWCRPLWVKAFTKKGIYFVINLCPRLTHVLRGRWSTGSSGFGCRASAVCSPGILSSGSLQTCCLCGRWLAASCITQITASIKNQRLRSSPLN